MARVIGILLFLLAAAAAEAAPLSDLRLPIDCRPGIDCWIPRYVDDDPGTGVRDYMCGKLTGEGHKGVDLAIPDEGSMVEGVAVRAAAPGVVVGLRDGMADVDVEEIGREAVAGRECGNGVRLDHGDGWATQYCHMRRGSITVMQGDRVAAGQEIGLVGMSGDTSFPHLHFEVQHAGQAIDPFIGAERGAGCGPGEHPLWRADVLAQLVYQPVILAAAGIAPNAPNAEYARRGYFDQTSLPTTSPALVVWVDAFWVEKGDRLKFRLLGPDLGAVVERAIVLEKDYPRWFGFAGGRRPGERWPAGTYHAEVTLERTTAGGAAVRAAIAHQIELR